jgi:phage tail sheath gpL-like
MALHTIVIDTPDLTGQQFIDDTYQISTTGAREAFTDLGQFLQAVSGGVRAAQIVIRPGTVAASGTLTFTGAPTAAQTCVIAGQTITARASGAVANEFNIGGTPTASATALAAAINASTALSGRVTATSALGVVTITCAIPGQIGNGLPLSTGMTNTTVSAAFLASGAEALGATTFDKR